mgnify:CR=1 FL=1
MKKLLIVLWFGKFPNYFELYLDSCSHNRSWNWMIFTDQDVDEYSRSGKRRNRQDEVFRNQGEDM